MTSDSDSEYPVHGVGGLRSTGRQAARIGHLGFDFERRTGYVVVAPLDQQDVLSALPDDVAHLVVVLFHVFDEYLLARPFRTVDAHEQYIVACNTTVCFIAGVGETERTINSGKVDAGDDRSPLPTPSNLLDRSAPIVTQRGA